MTRKSMRLIINLSLFLCALFIFSNESFSLTYYQIKKFCEKEKRQANCIKDLREKKTILEEGYLIEIPVIPHNK